MPTLPSRLAETLGDEAMPIAFCWRVERPDGIAVALTSHDRPLAFGGVRYTASPGMVPSAIGWSDDPAEAGMDVSGALSSQAITANDLAAGRYDGARLTLSIVDWTDPAGTQMVLASGYIGGVEITGSAFEAEFRPLAAALAADPIELTSPECRASLGDQRCRVDMSARTLIAVVANIVDTQTIDVTAIGDGGRFAFGRLRPIDGALAGLDIEIAAAAGGRLTLRDPTAARLAPGTRIQLKEGCDRRFATCRDRFANQANFRGEPHVPGNDSVAQYPGL
jgi:uncharacterized phage protein (TIGR02218 family)